MNTRRSSLGMALLIATLALLPGCDTDPKISDDDIKYVNNHDTFQAYLQERSRQPVFVLDPRPRARFEREHAAGAQNIPINELRNRRQEFGNAKTIIVIGGGPSDFIAPAATKTLMEMGMRNVYEYAGGLEAWKRAGGKTEGNAAVKIPEGKPVTEETSLDVYVPPQGSTGSY